MSFEQMFLSGIIVGAGMFILASVLEFFLWITGK